MTVAVAVGIVLTVAHEREVTRAAARVRRWMLSPRTPARVAAAATQAVRTLWGRVLVPATLLSAWAVFFVFVLVGAVDQAAGQ